MRRRDQWIEWIRAVERESDAATYAFELLDNRLQEDPSSLASRGLEHGDAHRVKANREGTYLVRAFAVFENGLREAWQKAEQKTTNPRMFDLLEAFCVANEDAQRSSGRRSSRP